MTTRIDTPGRMFFPLAIAVIAVAGLLTMPTTSYAQDPDRPLIFLPGILGSKLYKGDELVWGDRSSYRNFTKLRLPQSGDDDIVARGIIEKVRVLGPFRTKQYADLIEYLTDELNYELGETLFIFAYDWRKSNFRSAAALQELIENTPELSVGSFDIMAHSMGGIVSRILIDRHDAGGRVSRYITLGTPFLGSLDILEPFVDGFDGLQRLMAGNDEAVRSVMFSFESGYELLPSYKNCCYTGASWGERQSFELFDMEIWEDMWFPDDFKNDQGRAHVAAGFERRNQIAAIVDKQLDWNKTYHAALATSMIATYGKVRFNDDGSVAEWREDFQGDGRVTIESATINAPFHSRVSFSKHGKIFDDDAARDNIRRILITNDDLEKHSGAITTCEETSSKDCVTIGDYEISGAVLEATPGIVGVGEDIDLQLVIVVDTQGTDFPFSPSVCLTNVDQPLNAPNCVAMDQASATSERIEYRATHSPAAEGEYLVSINVDSGLGFAPDDYVIAFSMETESQ